MNRIEKEVDWVRRDYPKVEVPPDHLSWILVRDIPLPPGIYNRTVTSILIVLTPAYPATAPDNFYVEAGLRTMSGEALLNYSDGVQKLDREWGQFSWHVKDWRPTADVESGDNLRTFITSAISRLQEGK